ncbi:hypothetical protein SEA_GALACTICA_77 [Streptomyces phage Galactica]|nr:hypothetical protein SEA_GALACTICA_77 [Streptomyces phage Galactica]
MHATLVTDAADPLTRVYKGMDALGLNTNEVTLRFRRNTVVASLSGRLTDEQKAAVWGLFRDEFTNSGWGWRASFGNGFGAPATALALDHPIELTTLGR